MCFCVLQKNLFFIIGQLASMSLVQGGSGFNVLSPSVFKYLCGVNLRSIDVQPEEVPDPNICAIIEEVGHCILNHTLLSTLLFCVCTII